MGALIRFSYATRHRDVYDISTAFLHTPELSCWMAPSLLSLWCLYFALLWFSRLLPSPFSKTYPIKTPSLLLRIWAVYHQRIHLWKVFYVLGADLWTISEKRAKTGFFTLLHLHWKEGGTISSWLFPRVSWAVDRHTLLSYSNLVFAYCFAVSSEVPELSATFARHTKDRRTCGIYGKCSLKDVVLSAWSCNTHPLYEVSWLWMCTPTRHSKMELSRKLKVHTLETQVTGSIYAVSVTL